MALLCNTRFVDAALALVTLHRPDVDFNGGFAQATFCAETHRWLLAKHV